MSFVRQRMKFIQMRADPTTSFEVDERTVDLLAQLQKTFGVRTNAAVIRKAIALALVASRYAAADRTITISSGHDDEPPVKISLAG